MARGSHAPPPLAARGSTRRHETNPKQGVLQRPPPPFFPRRRRPADQAKNAHQSILIFVLCFFVFFKSASLFQLRFSSFAGYRSGDGSVDAMSQLLFATAEVVGGEGMDEWLIVGLRSKWRSICGCRRGGCRWRADLQTLLEEEGGSLRV